MLRTIRVFFPLKTLSQLTIRVLFPSKTISQRSCFLPAENSITTIVSHLKNNITAIVFSSHWKRYHKDRVFLKQISQRSCFLENNSLSQPFVFSSHRKLYHNDSCSLPTENNITTIVFPYHRKQYHNNRVFLPPKTISQRSCSLTTENNITIIVFSSHLKQYHNDRVPFKTISQQSYFLPTENGITKIVFKKNPILQRSCFLENNITTIRVIFPLKTISQRFVLSSHWKQNHKDRVLLTHWQQ